MVAVREPGQGLLMLNANREPSTDPLSSGCPCSRLPLSRLDVMGLEFLAGEFFEQGDQLQQ